MVVPRPRCAQRRRRLLPWRRRRPGALRLVTASLARQLSRGFTSESAMKSNVALSSRAPLRPRELLARARALQFCNLAGQQANSQLQDLILFGIPAQQLFTTRGGRGHGAFTIPAKRNARQAARSALRSCPPAEPASARGASEEDDDDAGRCASAAMCDLSHVSSLIAKYMATA